MFSAHPVHLVDREVAAFGYGHLFDGITAGIVDKVVSLQAFVSQKLDPEKRRTWATWCTTSGCKTASIRSIAVFSRYQNERSWKKRSRIS